MPPARRNCRAQLQLDTKDDCKEHFCIGSQSCYIVGRSKERSDIWLQHLSISRQHAVIAHGKQDQIYLMDLGSAQGTFLNDNEIVPKEPQKLADGDRIKFGASTRTYVFHNAINDEAVSTQKENKRTEAASVNPELQRMMREMQSFGGKHHHQKQNKDEPTMTEADATVEERKRVRIYLLLTSWNCWMRCANAEACVLYVETSWDRSNDCSNDASTRTEFRE